MEEYTVVDWYGTKKSHIRASSPWDAAKVFARRMGFGKRKERYQVSPRGRVGDTGLFDVTVYRDGLWYQDATISVEYTRRNPVHLHGFTGTITRKKNGALLIKGRQKGR